MGTSAMPASPDDHPNKVACNSIPLEKERIVNHRAEW
jgi:hypothetical protein